MKLDPVYTSRLDQRPAPVRRISEDQSSAASTLSISPERAEACLDLLRSVQPSGKVAKPRSEWQVSIIKHTVIGLVTDSVAQ